MTDVADLLKNLDAIREQTNLPFERRLLDTALYFHKNKDSIPRANLQARVDFFEKVMDCYLEMMVMCLDRMQEVEGRKQGTSLWLPKGMVDVETGKRWG